MAVIDDYEKGGTKLRNAIAGLSRQDLLWVPSPEDRVGLWSIQQIVMHLTDGDLIQTDRMKRVIAEENPLLVGFDETRFSRNLYYEEQSAEDAVTIFELNRKNFAAVLKKLPPPVYQRSGIHTERGKLSLGDLLGYITGHLDHHLKFIIQKREKLGKPIKE